MSKELEEKCLLTDEEIFEADYGYPPAPKDIKEGLENYISSVSERVAKAAVAKTLKLAEPLIRRECDEEWVEWMEKYNRSVWGGFSGDIPPVDWQARKKEKGIE